MTEPSVSPAAPDEDQAIDTIVRSGPRGAIAVASVATAIVVALWFGFYWLVFLPRSS